MSSLVVVFVAACGGAPKPAPAPTPQAAPEAWSRDLSEPQKMAFMREHVVPAMRPVFRAASATRYADFDCITCHGPAFKAPQEVLPKLTMKDGNLTAFAEQPDVAKFMAEQVVPNMAKALGQPPFDMKTGQGFGCTGCHAVEGQ